MMSMSGGAQSMSVTLDRAMKYDQLVRVQASLTCPARPIIYIAKYVDIYFICYVGKGGYDVQHVKLG